jgi:hypothetical protein
MITKKQMTALTKGCALIQQSETIDKRAMQVDRKADRAKRDSDFNKLKHSAEKLFDKSVKLEDQGNKLIKQTLLGILEAALCLALIVVMAHLSMAHAGPYYRELAVAPPLITVALPNTPTRRVDGNRIFNDVGGNVATYRGYGQKTMIIDGFCGSACLLTLGDGTCSTPRGKLHWHPATDQYGREHPEYTVLILASYTPVLRNYIVAHGGMSPGRQVYASQVFPRCG